MIEHRELPALELFLCIGADDPHTCQVLLCTRSNVGKELLYLLESDVNLMSEIFNCQRNERHRQQQNERQFNADLIHDRQDDEHPKKRLLAVHDSRPNYLAYRTEVVGRSRH